jgi:3-hydroxyisobutyrate dehydrogenase-like beta-hydroxyacid dehydrogenase
MAKLSFLGLGVMGYPMAGHLVAAGHQVSVWNRTGAKADKWADQYDGRAASSIAQAVQDADCVLMCVGNDDDVFDVSTEALKHMKSGTILVDHTTASAKCARRCAKEAGAKGIGFVDAPISGGEAGAVNGQLTIMCGGDQAIFDRAEPIMQVYGKAVKLMGPSGAGQLTKMVNQICIAGILQGLSEGVNFAQKAGLDVDEVIEAIGKGAAQSWQMDNRASTMAKGQFEFGFAVDWMRKDLKIAIEEADENGADLTLAKMVDTYYSEVQAMGGNRWDTSSLIKRLAHE